MTVIVNYDQNGKPFYQSAKGIGSTEEDRQKARQLDELLKTELSKLEIKLKKENLLKIKSKGNVLLYWELGNVLRNIFFNSHLIVETEKYLFWQNAHLYIPEELLAKDRGPNRLHLEYCFRLAGFPKEIALSLKWGEWVYLFDSQGINRENRFDMWFTNKMQENPDNFGRDDVRILSQTINCLLANKETNDLSNDQIERCYDVAWFIKENFIKRINEFTNKKLKEALKLGIKKNHQELGKVLDGTQNYAAFGILVSKEINSE